ncbi:DUF262 domain-containing protein [Streptomyces sp. NBC_01022]|uniref:DUF262 domain-containing protein n=1 Tax=Streptomyces sp. NBC_01022 TaxID=2903723 RepID=UPI002DDA4AF2|nr:DUF262 domain-containing protein [Streptomyces sp. NBC_01022]WRZ83345.1 DUF262 domain-containing protein [Streptomyces sp. NBC_01022]
MPIERKQEPLFDEDEQEAAAEQSDPLHVPIEERRLITQPYDLSLATLVDDIRRERLLLSIEYQRKYVWDRAKASRLIESFLLNIPVPVCYFAENEDGSYEVIDGLQRIQTIKDFLTGEFSLRGVSVVREFEGMSYDDLPLKEQRRLGNRTVRCIVITDDSHPDIKFDVFERLNTGSAMLAAQELRNCIYRGPLNTFLKEMSETKRYSDILGGLANKRMAYEELALRFFSLYEDLSAYKPPLRQLLNVYMRSHRNGEPDPKAVSVFYETCDVVQEIFGSAAFRLSKDGKLGAFNKALFDAIMLPLAFSDRRSAASKAPQIRELREELLDRETFQTAIGRATADRTRMHGRVKAFASGLTRLGVRCDLPALPE